MTEAPAIKAYVVTLVFGAGPIAVRTIFAPGPSEAVGLVTVQVMRDTNPTQDLTGLVVLELDAQWLRTATRAAEGKLPPDGEAQILSLVQPDPGQAVGQLNQRPLTDHEKTWLAGGPNPTDPA